MFNVIRILVCVTPISIGLFLLQPMNNAKTSFKCSTPGTDREAGNGPLRKFYETTERQDL